MSFRNTAALVILMILPFCIIAQSTPSRTIAVKIGNNGNIRLSQNKTYGQNGQVFNAGNGYQGGIEFFQAFFKILGIKGEIGHLNNNIEVDHHSRISSASSNVSRQFRETMLVNISSFNFSPSLVFNLGPLKIGCGPEYNWAIKATGKGERHYYEESTYNGKPKHVQYNYYSRRRQVYNQDNPDEKQTFKVNRLMQGLNLNIDVRVYKSISIEFKGLYPLSSFIDGFVDIDNLEIEQKTLNTQLSLKYTFKLKQAENKTKKRLP